MYDVSKCVAESALRDLEKAFVNFWRSSKNGIKIRFPKFKKKGRNDRFRLYGSIRVIEKAVQLPRIGSVRLKELPQIHGRILSATISRKADRWFVSLCVEQEIPSPPQITGERIGVDLGVRSLATLSNGRKIENPQALLRKLRKLRRYSRKVSKKKRGSKNHTKAIIRLARLHWRISNIRKDALHKTTTYLAKNHSQIIIENLGIKGMMKEQKISRAITDMGWGEFRRQLTYKTKWYGSELILTPRFFPSSKRCSNCGHTKKKFSLSAQLFKCKACGLHIDRDLNAANNLVAASWAETQNACHEMGGYRPPYGQCPSMKQEPNTSKADLPAG